MKYRIGRITTGATIVILGILLFISQATDHNWILQAVKLWPLILIGYGLEYLVHSRKQEKVSFDLGGAIFTLFIFLVIAGYSIISSLIFNFGDLDFAVEDQPIIYSQSEVESLSIHGTIGKVTIEAVEGNQIKIVSTYRSSSEQSLQKLKEEIKLSAKVRGGELSIEQDINDHWEFLGMDRTQLDLHIYAPKETKLKIIENVGNIEVFGMEHVDQLSINVGEILLRDSKGDANIKNTVGKIDIGHFVGILNVEHTIGEVKVDGEPNGDWQINSTIGQIALSIPEDGSYRYDTNVTIGSGDHSQTIGQGSYLIRANLTIGNIEITTK